MGPDPSSGKMAGLVTSLLAVSLGLAAASQQPAQQQHRFLKVKRNTLPEAGAPGNLYL